MTFYTGHETLYDYVIQNIPDGDHTFQTVADMESVDLDIEFVNIYGDTVYDGESPVLGNDTPNERLLVLKYWGNLQINHGITIMPKVPKKAMVIVVMGNLLNRGTISMTARGAYAPGQDVMLWKNSDGTFEYVPKAGGAGGAGVRAAGGNSPGYAKFGQSGNSAPRRGTGGGGSGGAATNAGPDYGQSGNGAPGNSYTGGGGSGGVASYSGLTSANAQWSKGTDAQMSGANRAASGGAGNPPGAGSNSSLKGQIGAGGLLIVYCERVCNNDFNAVISSNGSMSAFAGQHPSATGGCSGGGSINIFHRGAFVNNGKIEAIGGKQVNATATTRGGDGGDGSVTTMQVTFLQNRIRFYNDQHKPVNAMDMGYAIQGAYSEIAEFRAESLYLVPIKDLEIGWVIAPDSPSNEAILEFSKTKDPFIPQNPIKFDGLVLNYREGVEMYVRAKSGELQVDQTKFAITAKIEGV